MMEYVNLNESMQKSDGVRNIHLVPVPWDWRLIVQLILAIVGIVGNSVVVHVYLHTRKLTMSATNRFIAALAVADIITSICLIPIPTLSYVPDNFGGHFYCKVVASSVVMWTSIVASVFSLTILAIERYSAIAQPIRYKRLFSVNSTRLIIVLIWTFAFTFNTFVIYANHLDKVKGTCYVDFGSKGFQKFIGVSVFLVEYLVPIVLMLVANIRSIQLLKMRTQMLCRKQHQKSGDMVLLQARQRIIYMLLAVIITFVICWSPDQVGFLAFNLELVPVKYMYDHLYRVFVVLAFSNSCLNPVFYALTNTNFRQAIKQHLLSCAPAGRTGEPWNDLFGIPLENGELLRSKDTTDSILMSHSISASQSVPEELENM